MSGVLASTYVNLILGRVSPGQIGSLLLDATIREQHSYRNRVSNYPVEETSFISDHVQREPERITIDGFITQTPVAYLGGALSTLTSKAFGWDSQKDTAFRTTNRIQEAFTELLKMAGYDYPVQEGTGAVTKNPVQLIDVVTGLRSYTNMVITDLNIPRDSNTGHTLRFTLTLQKLVLTESLFTTVTPEEKIADDTKKACKKFLENDVVFYGIEVNIGLCDSLVLLVELYCDRQVSQSVLGFVLQAVVACPVVVRQG